MQSFINRLFILAVITAMAACNKNDFCADDTTRANQAEVEILESWLNRNGIAATKDERGFYYIIRNEGEGRNPTVCSNVSVNYIGKLTSGETFDEGQNVRFGLANLITGWKQGIPLIARGGSITLYLPPSLAYGSREQPNIPANSILIFDIDLLQVN